MESAAGVDLRSGNGICVDDELDGNLPALADSGPLDVPAGLLVERALADRLRLGGWLGIKQGSDPGADLDRRWRRELQLAPRLAQVAVAHAEIDQVAAAVADVGPAFLEAEFGLALAGVAAVNLDDPVLDGKSRARASRGGRETWPGPSSAWVGPLNGSTLSGPDCLSIACRSARRWDWSPAAPRSHQP